MRVTIVKDDNLVIIEKRPIRFDLSPYGLPKKFHALQWDNDFGEEEYNDGTTNKSIGDLSRYQPIIDEYMRLQEIEDNPPPPTESEKYASLINQRNSYLNQTDWLAIRHTDQTVSPDIEPTSLNDDQFKKLLVWRQELRELSDRYKTSGEWQWPDHPDFMVPKHLSVYPPENN